MDIPADLRRFARSPDGWDVELADRSRLPSAPVVSVNLITYQHATFIGQALDSVLSQDVDFPIEICLGEDGSTDGTREICFDYLRRHPDRIRLFLRDRGNPARAGYAIPFAHNGIETLRSCRGEFIALLDGDDFWTDPEKLSTQVDLMRRDPACAVCFHNVSVTYDDDRMLPHPFFSRTPSGTHMACLPPRRTTIRRLATGNFIPTPSVFYRNRPALEIPEWLKRCWACDWAVHMNYAERGDLVYLDRPMAGYRVHPGGVWSQLDPEERCRQWIRQIETMDAAFQYRYRAGLLVALRNAYALRVQAQPDLDLYGPGLPERVAAIFGRLPSALPLSPAWRRGTVRDAIHACFHRTIQEGNRRAAWHLFLRYLGPRFSWLRTSYLCTDVVELLAGRRVVSRLRACKRRLVRAAGRLREP
ncbi:MAG: glycosyltransferase [Lentisphaeria bacterium]|nr:glycosyltransferase [Lentisphaeria bacterium]